MMRVWIAFVFAVVATACRQNPECFGPDECAGGLACVDNACVDPTLVDVNWQVDILPIVARNCRACHGSPPGPGPIPLVTYADTQALYNGALVFERMGIRVADVVSPMPPAGSAPLTPAEIAKITAWVSRGAPQGPSSMGCDGGSCNRDGGPSPLDGTEVATFLMGGYARADGPAWNAANNTVFFVDSVGEQLYQAMLPAPPTAAVNVPGRPMGAAPNPNGGVFVALAGARSIASVDLNGPAVIAATYMGSMFNGPDDIVRRADGTLYFTDPGLTLAGQRQLDFNGLFRIPVGGGMPVLEWEGLPSLAPNGVAISPDGNRLYLGDSIDGFIRQFDIATDGSLSNERAFTFVQSSAPEGMTVDSTGNLYVATTAGVEVFAPNGSYFGVITTTEPATNVAFVGQDLSGLFITTQNAVYFAQMQVRGAP